MKILNTIIFILFISVTANAHIITGRILDERYFPVPNLQVSVSGGMSGSSDANGCFSVTTSDMPYTLLITDVANVIAVLYKNLNIPDPELTFFGGNTSKYANTEILKVEMLPVPRGRTAILKFISDDVFYSEDVFVSAGEKSKIISVDWMSTNNSINGKVIYIEKSQNKYEKYSEKSVIISKGFYPQTVYFDSGTYYSKPLDANILVYPPAKICQKKEFYVFADFLSQHRNAELLLNFTEGDIINTGVLIPRDLSYGYRLKLSSLVTFANGSSFQTFEYTYPGSTIYLNSEEPPALSGPQDKFWGVNNNTLFSYEWGSNSGVYVLHFHAYNPVGDFYIVTEERNVKSPLANSAGTLSGVEFSWSVSKYVPYLSVSDFVKQKRFANDLGYKAILNSELRTFRTKP